MHISFANILPQAPFSSIFLAPRISCCSHSASKVTPFFETWEQLGLFFATVALSVTAYRKNMGVAAASFALGAGLAASGLVKRTFTPASAGCSSSAAAHSQSSIPSILAVGTFYFLADHHLRHHPHPVEIGMIGFGVGTQVAHLFQHIFFSTGKN